MISLISIGTFLYLNGTISANLYSSPKPPHHDKMAAGGAMNKTNSSNSVSDVATKALAFEALLSTADQATLEQTYTTTLARKWSNLPCGAQCRNGIEFGNLTSAQLTAALAVIQAATGTIANDGYDEFLQIRLAEENLNANGGGSGYDTTLRWICFLNTPSATGPWMLQFGGHHYAANIAFNNGHVVGATPFFMGLEPTTFTFNNITYSPLTDEHDALAAMLASLTTSQLSSAVLSTTFTDCTMVPGETNGGTGTFPTTKVGVSCSGFTGTQKSLVLAAIQHYTQDMDAATAAAVLTLYTSEIDSTYIAYTGSGTSGDATTFLNTASNYVRIDGPGVWIELACQNGVVYRNQIHYHTVWRDHTHDYGVDLTGAAIDSSSTTGIAEIKNNTLRIYPNPATNQISLSLDVVAKDAKISVISLGTGQVVDIVKHFTGTAFQYDISKFAAGSYILRVEDGASVYTGKFNKL